MSDRAQHATPARTGGEGSGDPRLQLDPHPLVRLLGKPAAPVPPAADAVPAAPLFDNVVGSPGATPVAAGAAR